MNATITSPDEWGTVQLIRQWIATDHCNTSAISPPFTITAKMAPPAPVAIPDNVVVAKPENVPAKQTLVLQGGCRTVQILPDAAPTRHHRSRTLYTVTWGKSWDRGNQDPRCHDE